MRGRSPLPLRRLPTLEALEDRLVPSASSVSIALSPTLDITGQQIAAVEGYQNSTRATLSLFDTGSSAVTFSAPEQALLASQGIAIPIAIKGGGLLTGIGGTQTGDIASSSTILAAGLDAATLSFSQAGVATFSFSFGTQTATAANVQAFVGDPDTSAYVQSIVGTPLLSSSATQPKGYAAEIEMQGVTFNLSAIETGLNATLPDLRFVAPGTTLSPAAGTTNPVQISLNLIGADNATNPGNDITETPIPVQNHVTVTNAGTTLANNQFLFDTGAQITVISQALCKSFGLDISNPSFTTTVEGVSGPMTLGGFIIDSLSMPTTGGGTLTFTKVPVFVDTALPSGLNGILGMNLFNTATAMVYDPYASTGATFSVAFSLNGTRNTLAPQAVTALAQAGFSFSDFLDGPTLTAAPAELGSVSGQVYADYNGNGVQDPQEPGLAGQTVYLDLNGDGKLDAGDVSAQTNASGAFSLIDVEPGTYTLHEVIPGGWTPTAPVKGATAVTVSADIATSANFGNQQVSADPLTAYVTQLYGTILSRAPDSAGEQAWLAMLHQGTSEAVVAQSLWHSAEHNADEVKASYATYLNRSPSSAELASWVRLLQSGWTMDQVNLAIIDSPEYLSPYTSPQSFLTNIYTDVLGRSLDVASEYAWEQLLFRDVPRSVVANDIIHSQEAYQHAVQLFYSSILHRAADPSGLASWTQLLMGGRVSSDQLAIALLSSQEYLADANKLVKS